MIALKSKQKEIGLPVSLDEELIKNLYDIIMKVQYPNRDHNNFDSCFFDKGWPWDKKSKEFPEPNSEENRMFLEMGYIEKEKDRWYEFPPRQIISIISKTIGKIRDIGNEELNFKDVIDEEITTIDPNIINTLNALFKDHDYSKLGESQIEEINKLFLIIFRTLLLSNRNNIDKGVPKIYFEAREAGEVDEFV